LPVTSSWQDAARCPVILVAFMLNETMRFNESKLTCQLAPWPVTPFSDDSVLPWTFAWSEIHPRNGNCQLLQYRVPRNFYPLLFVSKLYHAWDWCLVTQHNSSQCLVTQHNSSLRLVMQHNSSLRLVTQHNSSQCYWKHHSQSQHCHQSPYVQLPKIKLWFQLKLSFLFHVQALHLRQGTGMKCEALLS
jgi:hypothetical protein